MRRLALGFFFVSVRVLTSTNVAGRSPFTLKRWLAPSRRSLKQAADLGREVGAIVVSVEEDLLAGHEVEDFAADLGSL